MPSSVRNAALNTGFECTIAAGGRVLMETTTIAGVGHLVWLADPSGNVVGAMTYDSSAR